MVDQDNPGKLAQALEMILNDAGLRDRLTACAWDRARVDFSLDKARGQFAELMGLGSL